MVQKEIIEVELLSIKRDMSRKWGVGPIMKKLNENVYTKLHELFNKVFYAPTEAELERYPGWRHNLSSWQYVLLEVDPIFQKL